MSFTGWVKCGTSLLWSITSNKEGINRRFWGPGCVSKNYSNKENVTPKVTQCMLLLTSILEMTVETESGAEAPGVRSARKSTTTRS